MIAADENRLGKVYAAIADPTRRTMLTALANAELTVGALAQRFPITFKRRRFYLALSSSGGFRLNSLDIH